EATYISPSCHQISNPIPAEVILPTLRAEILLPKTHIFSVGLRGHFPTACEVCSQQRRCRQPHTFGLAGSLNHANSARISSMLEWVRGIRPAHRKLSAYPKGDAIGESRFLCVLAVTTSM